MNSSGEAVLEYSGVSKVYTRSHLGRLTRARGVEDLSLRVRPGEIFGLLGLNGNGKTTTLKLAVGLLRPSRGSVRAFGLDPESPLARSRVGFLPELPSFCPFLTPRETLDFYGALSGLPKAELGERVERTLARVGLARAAGRKARELSKGMLQRLGLAQAVLHEPRLLVLDEPVSGLDPLAIHETRLLLSSLNKEGCSILLSSHSISEVERLCARAAILVEGRLERLLTQEEWESRPQGLEGLFIETVRPRP